MKLHFTPEWLRKKNLELPDDIEEPYMIGPTMSSLDLLISSLCDNTPETQIDPMIVKRLMPLVGKDEETVKEKIKEILDDCVNGSLCSDFVVVIMDGILNGQY